MAFMVVLMTVTIVLGIYDSTYSLVTIVVIFKLIFGATPFTL